MQNTYSIHPEFSLLCKRLSGHVTHEQLTELGQRAFSDARYEKSMRVFEDLRNLETVDFDYNRVRSLGQSVAKRFTGYSVVIRTAHYAPGDLAFGIARMFQTILSDSQNLDIGVFRDFDEAVDFLGLPEEARAMLRTGEPEMAGFF